MDELVASHGHAHRADRLGRPVREFEIRVILIPTAASISRMSTFDGAEPGQVAARGDEAVAAPAQEVKPVGMLGGDLLPVLASFAGIT